MWVDEPGRPVIRTELEVEDGRVQRLALQQRDPQGRDRRGRSSCASRWAVGSSPRRIVTELVGREVDLMPSLEGCVPEYVLAGGEGWGYGEFELDARSRLTWRSAYPASAIRWPGPSPGPRYGTPCWRANVAGAVVRHGPADLRTERDVQLIGDWLADLKVVWWRFLRRPNAPSAHRTLEALLRSPS